MLCTSSLAFNNCTLCPHCIYVFYIYLRTNSDLCHLHHKLIGFYNLDEKCLQRGTDWVFKSLTLRLLMSFIHIYIYIYIYMEHLFLMFLDDTKRRSTVGRTPPDE